MRQESRHRLARLAALALLAPPLAATAQSGGYESAPRVYVDRVLPAELLRSGNHQVLDEVESDGHDLLFTVDSDFGRYRVRSAPMVALRVAEIRILAQAIDAFQRENERLAARLRGRLQVGADSFVQILTSPLRTSARLADQLASNVGQTLEEINRFGGGETPAGAAPGPGGGNVYASLVPGDPVVAAHKRSVASQLGLDVYSTNPRVQDFLDTVALARARGQRSAGTVAVTVPRGPLRRPGGGAVEAAVRSALTHQSIREIYERNQQRLAEMGVDRRIVDAFLTERWLSPRHQTELVEYAALLEGVEGRPGLIEAALGARSEAEALARVTGARLLALYHEGSPLRRLLPGADLVAATTASGGLVLVLPFDLLVWDAATARLFDALAGHAERRGYRRRDVLLEGIATGRARRELEARGFTLAEHYGWRR